MKYWPPLSDVISEISTDAGDAEIVVNDPVSAAALSSSRSSKADFCRALFERVEICKRNQGGQLPDGFRLKDETWATLINILLDIDGDALVGGDYVKRLRQRTRESDPT